MAALASGPAEAMCVELMADDRVMLRLEHAHEVLSTEVAAAQGMCGSALGIIWCVCNILGLELRGLASAVGFASNSFMYYKIGDVVGNLRALAAGPRLEHEGVSDQL